MQHLSRNTTISIAFAALVSPSIASAATATFFLDYVATNAVANTLANPSYSGYIAANGGPANVGTIVIQDLSDLGLGASGNGFGGVRVTVNAAGIDGVFKTGSGNLWARSFELNFPNTSVANGYDSNANGGLGNNWANAGGLALSNGVEWQEGGTVPASGPNGGNPAIPTTDRWASNTPDGTQGFSQELNWSGGIFNATSFTSASTSSVDLFSNALVTLSVATLLGDSNLDGTPDGAVRNVNATVGAGLPLAYAWLRLQGTGADNGIKGSGFWGTSENAGTRVNVLATTYSVTPSPVPVPAAVWLLGSAVAGMTGVARRRA